MTARRLIVASILLFALGTLAYILLATRPLAADDPCFASEHPRQCLIDTAHHMAMDGDIPAALTYAVSVIAPYNRNTVHFAMHMIGMEAYHHADNRADAMAFLPQEAATNEHYLVYEGYQHGLLMAYFNDENDTETLSERIRESCNDFWVAENNRTEDFTWRARMQCFHAVGHGLMYALANDLPDAFAECAKLPYFWMQDRCSYGAAMENSYLYNPEYDPSLPRPSAQGESMATVCNNTAVFKEQCALFVGRSYLAGHRGEYEQAFAECGKLATPSLASLCREQIASVYITDAGEDFEKMARVCKTAKEHEIQCLADVARGVAAGYAGTAAKKRDFCESLEEPLATKCATFTGAEMDRQ